MRLNKQVREAVKSVSGENLMKHVARISEWIRTAGTAGESRAFDYIENSLADYGLEPVRLLHDAYISVPKSASLRVVSAETADAIPCITHSFAASCSQLDAELWYSGDASRGATGARDRIAVVEGLATPEKISSLKAEGVAGAICIGDVSNPREMTVSPIWGSPSHRNNHLLPTVPVLSVGSESGPLLRARAKEEAQATISAEVETRWLQIPLISVDIAAEDESKEFVLMGGHVDSWHYGAHDNATGNACQLEMARLFVNRRDMLKRSLRIVFWSGHSHGRYAGSQWYADEYYSELRRKCVANLMADMLGGRQSTITDIPVMKEMECLALAAVEEVTGSRPCTHRVPRAGDQSFWGIGIPSAYITLSSPQQAGSGEMGGSDRDERPDWWHTPEDTVDVIDPDLLLRDSRVYAATLAGLLSELVLPLDYRKTVQEVGDVLDHLEQNADEEMHLLGDATAAVSRLKAVLSEFYELEPISTEEIDVVNRVLMTLGRHLVPLNYTRTRSFRHDPALPQKPLSLLREVRLLNEVAEDSDLASFVKTAARQQVNGFESAINEATLEVRRAITELTR